MRFQMATPVTVPLAGLATGDHDDVAQLGPAAIEAIVDDEAPADAGAEREHDQIRRSSPRSEAPLGERRRVAVVLDAGGDRSAPARDRGSEHGQREIDRPQGDARAPIDVERDPISDRGRTVREQILDDAVDRGQHLGLVPSGVAISIVRPIVPSRATRPARIFVPPRSTPITRSSRTSRLR